MKFIADWLEEPKNAKNVDYACDEECIRFADGENILDESGWQLLILQNLLNLKEDPRLQRPKQILECTIHQCRYISWSQTGRAGNEKT